MSSKNPAETSKKKGGGQAGGMEALYKEVPLLKPKKIIPAPQELSQKVGFPLNVGRTATATSSPELSEKPFIGVVYRDGKTNKLLCEAEEQIRRGRILADLAKASGITGLDIEIMDVYFPSDAAFERFCRFVMSLRAEELQVYSQREKVRGGLGKPDVSG